MKTTDLSQVTDDTSSGTFDYHAITSTTTPEEKFEYFIFFLFVENSWDPIYLEIPSFSAMGYNSKTGVIRTDVHEVLVCEQNDAP